MQNRKHILSVTIRRMIDESPDTSWLGEYASRPNSEFSIDRAHSEDCIENDSLQKEKLNRIADAIENDRPVCEDHTQQYDCDSVCEDHTQQYDCDCDDCQEEKVYTNTMDAIRELAECDCGERGDMERNQYRYFNPSDNYKGEPAEDIRKYVRQNYERMKEINSGNVYFIGVRADARVCLSVCKDHSHMLTQDITSGGLWGIESDSDGIAQEEQEQLSELRTELKALGFSSRAISTAFKNVERKNS